MTLRFYPYSTVRRKNATANTAIILIGVILRKIADCPVHLSQVRFSMVITQNGEPKVVGDTMTKQ
jgi:hypothetical protein